MSASRSAWRTLEGSLRTGEFPQWELCAQVMSDDEHAELDFDPLDDTKTWPEDVFPPRPVGMMTLNRNITSHHDENEHLVTLLGQCDKHIQEKMVWHFSQCDDAYGERVASGLGLDYATVRA